MPPGQRSHEVGEMPNSPKTRDNPNVPRDTLVDFFRDLAEIRAEFLVYYAALARQVEEQVRLL